MTKDAHYARALYALIDEKPDQAKEYLHAVEKVLARHGHQKLLPRIFAQYRRLLEAKARAARYRAVTPAQTQTRALLELYRKLVATE